MTPEITASGSASPTLKPPSASALARFFSMENKYLVPMFITTILIVGQISFGFLESWSRTFLAIGAAILTEMVLGRLITGQWPNLASAYISGISVGILIRSPEFWPYAASNSFARVTHFSSEIKGNCGLRATFLSASSIVRLLDQK